MEGANTKAIEVSECCPNCGNIMQLYLMGEFVGSTGKTGLFKYECDCGYEISFNGIINDGQE